MNDRIIKLIKAEGMTNSKFASILGIQRSNVTHIIDGRNKPSLSFIEKLIDKFPYVNIEWLMTGTGEMYKQKNTSDPRNERKKDDSPTLFPDVVSSQLSPLQNGNQSVRQNVEQDFKKVAEVANIPQKQKLESKLKPKQKLESKPVSKSEPESESRFEVVSHTEIETKKKQESRIIPPQTSGNTQDPRQLTPFEPESNEREIECVLIFHSDKTFKYYKPQ